ncbi:DUF1810 domain-containing protein [Thiocapsa bogorovii]|uniref:DUF1810 domain-containing protein n=1 Tax=Thiocapsa bogorovii TaxID=521689 RepID=UPI001E348EFD|nr:DUF1810 domain-containing protein [Thiocapsa bogorovii]UHD16619.1 DUF1810 domain-containing protein [Thiocapsa bogorovii]
MTEEYDLQRFLSAQGDDLGAVVQELKYGQKSGHWMWYVFPQVKGLGRSSTSEHFAIQNEGEARAYLLHPVLGERLIECTEIVNQHRDITAERIFGYPDYLKFRSSMTLFERVAGENSPFSRALEQFYGGERDALTLSILKSM